MPNWVNNLLVIKGEKATLEAIHQKCQPFHVVPEGMSVADFIRQEYREECYSEDALNNIVHRYDDIVPDKDRKIPIIYYNGHPYEFSFNCFVPQDKHDPAYQNGKQHGCSTQFNWYDWNRHHWGTKWDAGESRVKWEDDNLVITFDTPWDIPSKFLEKFSRLYPDVTVELHAYEEQGQYKCQTYQNGQCNEQSWEWCKDKADTDDVAKKFLETFAKDNDVENIFDIVDLGLFTENAYFDVQDEEDIRKYANPTIKVEYWDEPKELVEVLNRSSKGTWCYDSDTAKYSYHK